MQLKARLWSSVQVPVCIPARGTSLALSLAPRRQNDAPTRASALPGQEEHEVVRCGRRPHQLAISQMMSGKSMQRPHMNCALGRPQARIPPICRAEKATLKFYLGTHA